jgi:hypothetical protein
LLAVRHLLGNYQTTEHVCNRGDDKISACDAMVLGSLLKVAQKARLWPFLEPPYKGFSVEGLKKDILALEIKTFCDITDPENGLKVHKGQMSGRRKQRGFVGKDKYYSQSRFVDDDHLPPVCVPYDGWELMASQAVKGSVAGTINSLSGKLCGLKIEESK